MRLKSYFLMLIALVFLSACSSPEVEECNPCVNHKENRLVYMKRMLGDLNNVIYSRHKSEIERDDDRRRYANNFAETLKTMSSRIIEFPKNDATFKIKESDIEYYEELSKKLYTQGVVIQKIADAYEFKALNLAIEDVKMTCTQCHDIVNLGFDPLKGIR